MKLPLLAAFAAAAFLGAMPSLFAEPAPAQAAVKMPVIDFVEYDLPNGLHVILHQNKTAPVVSTYLLYHVGSKNERADRTGFAHFFEHLMFEGSENIQRGQIDKLVSAAGGNLNASTSFDRTDYHFNLPANQLGLALWIESERMLHGKVEEVGVETQRQVVKEERRLGTDNAPYGTLFENLAAAVFAGTPYQWTPIGSAQYIDQASLAEFRDFYHKYYVPNNATLVVAGDFDIEAVKKQIAAYFGPIPRGKEIERPQFELQPQTAPTEKTVALPTTPLPAAVHAWRAPAETADDAPAVELLADILGTGRSSRLHERLVRQEQAASAVDVFPYLLEKGGTLGIFATGNPGTPLEKLDKILDEEIAKVRDHGVSAEELQKVKNNKLRELASSYATMQNRARNLAHYHVMFGDTNALNHQWERYDAVTPEAIQAAAVKYLTPQGANVLHYPVVKPNPSK
ncbi:MAG: pitrilysin family protein [Chthoniobacteraceae bacterium]|nr:pitrilysin family protein [Chthoniobacteraceae bacterium]